MQRQSPYQALFHLRPFRSSSTFIKSPMEDWSYILKTEDFEKNSSFTSKEKSTLDLNKIRNTKN